MHAEGYGYSQFCEIYRPWARKLRPSMRQQDRAGEKALIDFSGQTLHLVDGVEVVEEASPTARADRARRDGHTRPALTAHG